MHAEALAVEKYRCYDLMKMTENVEFAWRTLTAPLRR
jgi:hypothetical protein